MTVEYEGELCVLRVLVVRFRYIIKRAVDTEGNVTNGECCHTSVYMALETQG